MDKNEAVIAELDNELKELLLNSVKENNELITRELYLMDWSDKIIEKFNTISKLIKEIFNGDADYMMDSILAMMKEERTGFQKTIAEQHARGFCYIRFMKLMDEKWPKRKNGPEVKPLEKRREFLQEFCFAPFSLDDIWRMISTIKLRKKPRGKICIDF